MRKLPAEGKPSTKYPHLGLWVFSLGPHSPVPGDRLRLAILDESGNIVRRFEQVEGACTDDGYVDFFNSQACRPAHVNRPLVDIDASGKQTILHTDYSQSLGMGVYLELLGEWARRWGKPEYALNREEAHACG